MEAATRTRSARNGSPAVATLAVALLALLWPAALRAGPAPADRPVLHVHQGGGLGGNSRTRLILWSSGRAALMTPDLVLRETRIDPAAAAALVRAADVLLDLPDYLAGNCGDDVG